MMVFLKTVLTIHQPHLRGCSGGCYFPEVVGHGLTFIRPVDQKAAATNITGAGIGHCQGKGRRHRRVDGAATFLQNLRTNLRCKVACRYHHAMAGPGGCIGGRNHTGKERCEQYR